MSGPRVVDKWSTGDVADASDGRYWRLVDTGAEQGGMILEGRSAGSALWIAAIGGGVGRRERFEIVARRAAYLSSLVNPPVGAQ